MSERLRHGFSPYIDSYEGQGKVVSFGRLGVVIEGETRKTKGREGRRRRKEEKEEERKKKSERKNLVRTNLEHC